MIVCPNCSHQNPDGAVQCEACYTPLPAMVDCPTCGASVQSDASFCGQCGANLSNAISSGESGLASPSSSPNVSAQSSVLPEGSGDLPSIDIPDVTVPDLAELDPLIEPEPLTAGTPDVAADIPSPSLPEIPDVPDAPANMSEPSEGEQEGLTVNSPSISTSGQSSADPSFHATQIQTQAVQLLHTHTNTLIDVPPNLSVIHIGKPNDRIPPDIDVSGFKDSEVVSRVHADIRVEGDSYYIEDVGSSNGTYVNNIPLAAGNRHRLRAGDRIALGKGDKVSFIVQMS